ncbi:N-acetylmuramoyl-L-alanine amidase [Nocardia sp. NPDC057353]|uniref:N-acetylmuramoyl-L-alanine amidase n=1 Tax=Nocardia sp. NPDC057353 TaxID=3346104 RepID=UPI003630716C
MPARRPKRSYVLPVVAILAVAAPLATFTMGDSARYDAANESELAAVPAQLVEAALAAAPDVVLPLDELTGLDLPDLRLSDLRMLPLPESVPVPPGIPAPPGVALPSQVPLPKLTPGQSTRFIADPTRLEPGTTPDTPALTPGALPAEYADLVGTQVKQIAREQPFSMVALTAADLAGTNAMVRAAAADGSWGPWFDAEPVDTGASDHSGPPRVDGTEPVYVGSTNLVQVLVTKARQPGATITPIAEQVDPAHGIPDLTAVLIDPGRADIDGGLAEVAGALPDGGPRVISRAQWGADESMRCMDPTYDDMLGGFTVHHTAGRNDYSRAESAGIVRAIYAYHAETMGWCDIGYNALVDKYGQIFEGRAGGLDRPVQGAHAGGFNENTAGVALMGDHESEAPTSVALNAVGQYVGWRTRIAGLDPKGQTLMYSEGTEYTPYAEGEEVELPIVFAHRDVGNTSCPGDAAYAMMDRIRDIAAGGPAQSTPDTATGADLDALVDLTGRLLRMVNDNIIARYYAEKGGAASSLGDAVSEPLPAAQGQQYAKFANGYVYTGPSGQVVEVLGAILDRFLQLGADAGVLGLPLANAYPVPDGLRADFQYGSLILNQLTGIVTTVWKTYNDTYQEEMRKNPAGAPIPDPAPAPAPAG